MVMSNELPTSGFLVFPEKLLENADHKMYDKKNVFYDIAN